MKWAALLVLAVAAVTARAGPPSPFETALADWRNARQRPLGEKIAAARRLASTRDPAALKELLAEFGKPAKNHDKFCELVAPSLAFSFVAAEFVPTWNEALLKELTRPQDGWLAYNVAAAWADDGRASAAVDLCLHAEALPFHQAAALRALARTPNATAMALASDVVATLPDAEPRRSLLFEAAARVVETNAPTGDDKALRAAVEPLLLRLADKETTRRTATIVGRTLARILGADAVYADAESWRKFIDDRAAAEKLAKEGYAPSKSYFAGVMLTGRDIVYVIDCSGSMNDAFTWRPPTSTGAAPTPPAGKNAKEEQDVLGGLGALPWDKIKTRLDAVREALKASLRGLEADQRFAVVMFAGEARYMSATPKLVPATRANVEETCSDVDRFGPGGGTNVHRALELGFGASRTKVEDPATGVGVDQIVQGADTVVVLTDGDPTADSYDPVGQTYASGDNILVAARRWNLFLDCEIDCVGLADASQTLLESLARLGNGRSRFLGK